MRNPVSGVGQGTFVVFKRPIEVPKPAGAKAGKPDEGGDELPTGISIFQPWKHLDLPPGSDGDDSADDRKGEPAIAESPTATPAEAAAVNPPPCKRCIQCVWYSDAYLDGDPNKGICNYEQGQRPPFFTISPNDVVRVAKPDDTGCQRFESSSAVV